MKPDVLTPENGFIFRITHIDNIPDILENGILCRSSPCASASFRTIGAPGLIERRASRSIPVPPGGTLADYVPFYFTPWSPMLLNILTGFGVPQLRSSEIVILGARLAMVTAAGIPFVVTDRHAYLQTARYSAGADGLATVDWETIRSRDFKRSADDPERFERYQAEALVHDALPVSCIAGIVTADEAARKRVDDELRRRGLEIRLRVDSTMYF